MVEGGSIFSANAGSIFSANQHEAFKSAWQRSIAKAVKKSRIERFTFHDLKRKGVSDFSGDKLLASGHHSASMLRIYDVSIGRIPATK